MSQLKECAVCRRTYDLTAFLALTHPRKGGDQYSGGVHYWVRDCLCGNTLYLEDIKRQEGP